MHVQFECSLSARSRPKGRGTRIFLKILSSGQSSLSDLPVNASFLLAPPSHSSLAGVRRQSSFHKPCPVPAGPFHPRRLVAHGSFGAALTQAGVWMSTGAQPRPGCAPPPFPPAPLESDNHWSSLSGRQNHFSTMTLSNQSEATRLGRPEAVWDCESDDHWSSLLPYRPCDWQVTGARQGAICP